MLKLENIHAAYGQVKVLFGVDLVVKPGEIHCLLGRNGAGKTTVLRTIMGLLRPSEGRVLLGDQDLTRLPAHEICRQQIGYVPQGRRLFPDLTVAENIEMGLHSNRNRGDTRDWVLEMFPRLRERLGQQARTLSGGEQQMLAMARALCLRPKLLLLDEPTEGLQPSMIELIRNVVVEMKSQGVAVILVEQRVDAVLSIADQVTFLEHGHDLETLAAAALRADHAKIHRYLGV